MATVKEMMSSPVLSIDMDKTAKEAADYMSKNRRGFLVVTSRGKPVGVISESDLIRITAKDMKPSVVKIKDIMSKPVVTVSPSESVDTALNKMKKSNIHRLPVTDKGKIVGVISLTDIARKSKTQVSPDILELRRQMKEESPEIKEEFTSGICDNCENYSENLKHINDEWLCAECKEDLEREAEE